MIKREKLKVCVWRHNELQDDLAAHLRADVRRMVWTNINLGPVGSPRPDIYTIFKSFSQPRPMAYEVKISANDYRGDVTSGKWQKYLQYAGGVIFAVPKGLITRADLPTGCGLIIRSENAWRVTRAPVLHPVDISMDTAMKLLMVGPGDSPYIRPRRIDEWDEAKTLRKSLGRDVAAVVRDVCQARRYIKDTREQAEAIENKAREDAKQIKEVEGKSISILRKKIAIALGVSEEISLSQLVDMFDTYIKDRQGKLLADSEVRRLTDILDQIQSAIDQAAAGPKTTYHPYWR